MGALARRRQRVFEAIKIAFSLMVMGVAGTATAAPPQAGDVYRNLSETPFPGWRLVQQGFSLGNTPVAVFTDGETYIVASVELVSREGVEPAIWRIAATVRERARPGEIEVMGGYCYLMGLEPALAFYSASTHIARGVFVSGSEITLQRWLVDEPHGCEYGGD